MIDLRTLLVLVAVADLMVAVILLMGAGRRLSHGIVAWISALAARALAVSILALGMQPQVATIAVSASLLALSMTLQGSALLAYDSRRLPAWVHTAVIAGVALPFSLIGTDAAHVVLFGGIVFGTLLAMLTASFALGAVAFYFRGVAATFAAEPMQAFAAPTMTQSAIFVAACAAAIVSTFGFLLLHKERADHEALRLATMDPLTGAYNRRTFHEIAERELSRALRAGQPLSIIIVDIDHFRAINETYGNRIGDQVLQRIAALVHEALRKEDMLVRYGGEEFLVMLPDVPGPGAVVVAGRIRKSVDAAPLKVGEHELAVTVSVGVSARLDEGPESIENLLARADEALSLAKQRGRNRVVALSLGRSIAA